MSQPIYLDYAATTPVDPVVAEAMARCLTIDGTFANPASRSHIYGWQAEQQVEQARGDVASLIGADRREVVWTSGATESDNLALKGVFEHNGFEGHLITSTIEHKAIIDTVKYLEHRGVRVSWLEPNAEGVVSVESVEAVMARDTRLVSLMLVNNEVGSVNPIAEIGQLCRQRDIALHVDAAQAIGKVAVNVVDLCVDMMSLSAHKFYGPKGVGALFVRRAVQGQLSAQMHGGGHERGMRSGTLPTHQLVGLGQAAKRVQEEGEAERERLALLRDQLWAGIESLPGVLRNGPHHGGSPAHLNVAFQGVDGETLMLSLQRLALSSGSACTSASVEPSYVLKAMGLSDALAHGSLRLSLGRFTTESEVVEAIEHIRSVYGALRQAD